MKRSNSKTFRQPQIRLGPNNIGGNLWMLTILSLVMTSAALGNHLDSRIPFDIHKPDEARNPALDPTLQRFLSPSTDHKETERVRQDRLRPTSPTPLPITLPHQKPGSNSPIPHTQLGWKFLLHGDPNAALAAYRLALRHNPGSDKAYLGLGMALKSVGKTEDAKQAIDQALALNPHLAPALVHLGYLYADGQLGLPNPDAARTLFKQAIQIGDPFARVALLDLQSRSDS
jgi:tetratricopeptide (TPR) repeat protein